MPSKKDLTPEEAEQRRRSREIMREMDREDSWLFSEQMARMDAEEKEESETD